MKTEIKVGLFVLLGIVSLLFLTFQIKTLESLKSKGYVLYALLDDASGLTKKSRVKLRGVKVGVIDDMELENNAVKLKLLIKKGVKIPKGSKVAVAQDNVLGGKYLKIIPSNSSDYYKPGEIITQYEKVASMEDLMNNINSAVEDIKVLIAKLNKTVDEKTIDNIHRTMENVKLASIKLNNILSTLDNRLPNLIDNANDLILSYKQTGDILKNRLPSLLDRIDTLSINANSLIDELKVKIDQLSKEYIKVGQNVNSILENNKEELTQTLTAAKGFFESGSSSFKKIDEFLSSVNKSQLMVDISSHYLLRDEEFTTTANIAYLPNPTKYYILGITSRQDPQTDESKVYINAQIGKRYDNVLLRGGIIESTGGVGVDYFTIKDKVKLSAEVYDFNAENDDRGDNAHLNLKATYLYLKHLQFIAGIDNVLNTDARSFFLGLGIKFKDNDLKPFLSGGASSFLK